MPVAAPTAERGTFSAGYLKVDPTCEACGHENNAYRADDGPAYFTVLIIGHLLIVPLLVFPVVWQANPWIVLPLALAGLTTATLTLLGFVKGGFIGVLWGTRAGAVQ
ncbi:MAG TPA: DUF983 domain-containing protein [Caulobacteraceae bacterium]